jgi:hypothetical protein
MKKRVLALVCTGALLLTMPAGASPRLYKVTYIVTGTGSATALVSYHDRSGAVSKTVRLPFKFVFKAPAGTSVAVDASIDSNSSKATIACEIKAQSLRTVKNSSSGPEAFVLCN